MRRWATSGTGLGWLAIRALVGLGQPAPGGGSDAEAPFLAQNQAAMTKMMAGMTIKPSGDVDRDFVDMMVPHHQGAIDIALAVLRYGHNAQIRRMAQGVIVTQR